jgi:hypothetical protein
VISSNAAIPHLRDREKLTEMINLFGVYHYDAHNATVECVALSGLAIYRKGHSRMMPASFDPLLRTTAPVWVPQTRQLFSQQRNAKILRSTAPATPVTWVGQPRFAERNPPP